MVPLEVPAAGHASLGMHGAAVGGTVGAGAAPSLLGAVPVTPVFACVCFHNILW